MASSAPDSSPMAAICSTMFGKTFAFCIDTVRPVPVDTSCWIFLVACRYTMLPDAPPTESSASTSGTPAANMVDSVRSHRAIVALRSTLPKIGSLSMNRSMAIWTAGDRCQACFMK